MAKKSNKQEIWLDFYKIQNLDLWPKRIRIYYLDKNWALQNVLLRIIYGIYSNLLQRCFDPDVQGVKYSSEAKSPICGSLIVRFWRFSSVYGRLPTWRHGFLRLSHYDDHLQEWKGAEKFKAGQGGVQCSTLHRQSALALENYLRILSRFHDGIYILHSFAINIVKYPGAPEAL